MDEYGASYSYIKKIINATQCMKECLVCRICLELFKEPVTIKCGHKFCRSCILKVTNNEHSTCPFCNIKIQKRSIPKEGNVLLQSAVELFNNLTDAIRFDSGIDVLEPYSKFKNTKENVFISEQSNKPENISTTSKESLLINKKLSKSIVDPENDKKFSSKRKHVNSEEKTSNNTNNSLHNYLPIKADCVSNQEIYTEEKVKSWLKNITEDDDNVTNNNHCHEDITINIQNSNEDSTIIGKSSVSPLKESLKCSLSTIYRSINKSKDLEFNCTESTNLEKEQKYKAIKIQKQEVKIMAKRKKSKQSKAVLKTSTSMPASLHSDADDWLRVKRVGKEMQAKTFKSLNVSIEKTSSSVVLDDTLPCNSTNNESKSISREFDTNNYSSNNITALKAKPLKVNDNLQEKKHTVNINVDCSKKCHSMDSSSSYKEKNNSLSFINEKKVNEIIGIFPLQDNLNTPEITRNTSSTSNLEFVTKLNQLSPLKIQPDKSHQKNEDFDDESSNYDYKTASVNLKNTSSKHKLPLKKKFITYINSKLNLSQSNTPDKIQLKNESPRNFSPERPRSKLSLRLATKKSNECFSNQEKSPIKNRPSDSDLYQSNRSLITFTKLGKMCRKRKNISFLRLGRLRPNKRIIICSPTKQESSGLVIKSNIPINIDYNYLMAKNNVKTNNEVPICTEREVKMLSPEKDSQLKFLSVKSPNHLSNKPLCTDINVNSNKSIICKANIPMEIDEPILSISKRQIDLREKQIHNYEHSKKSIDLVEKTIDCCMESTNADRKIIEADLEVAKKCKKDEAEISENDEILNPVKKNHNIQKRLIYISSDDTESRNTESHSICRSIEGEVMSLDKDKNKNSDIESNSDSQSLLAYELNSQQEFKKDKSSISTSSSPLETSVLKKKRTHSESSNDEDVSSIIGKWCDTEEPVIKKQKVLPDIQKDLNINQKDNELNDLEGFFSDDNDNTLVDNALKKSKENKQHKDPPVDEIIGKVESFKENAASTNKYMDMPSSLLSADLFEFNEECVEPSNGSYPKQSNKITSDDSSVSTCSPNKKSYKSHLSLNQNSLNGTIIDLNQFHTNKSDVSECSENSNKENDACNQIPVDSIIKEKIGNADEIRNSQNDKSIAIKNDSACSEFNMYHISDSLMNITQEQLAMKKIEKALIGVNLSEIHPDKNKETFESSKFSTPRRKFKHQINNITIDDFDSDNIDATPISKKRQLFQFQTPKSKAKLERNKSNIISPDTSLNLIPAVTPMKNRKSYPLCHSTPMVNIPGLENKSCTKTKSMTLICSGLQSENIKLVQTFTKIFGANFQNNFDMKVTHVVVQTDSKTKAGQKTFKYIQGIAFKKYVVSFQWIIDCLKQNSLLEEDEEKYEVLDPDIFESGSKKSRARKRDLFEDFAFYCHGPFNSFPLNEFKNLLLYNGAIVTSTIKALSLEKEKYKIVILEFENLSQNKISTLKKSGGALISFEWIVDSISQYQILSLSSYLCEMTVEEASALGFPPEYFVEEETIEEKEEEEDDDDEEEEEET